MLVFELVSMIFALSFPISIRILFIFRAAVAELLKEAQRGSNRAEVGGALAWKKPPKVNHRLLKNTLAQAVVSNIRTAGSKIREKKHSRTAPGQQEQN